MAIQMLIYPLKMVMFHSYVSLPEGNPLLKTSSIFAFFPRLDNLRGNVAAKSLTGTQWFQGDEKSYTMLHHWSFFQLFKTGNKPLEGAIFH